MIFCQLVGSDADKRNYITREDVKPPLMLAKGHAVTHPPFYLKTFVESRSFERRNIKRTLYYCKRCSIMYMRPKWVQREDKPIF